MSVPQAPPAPTPPAPQRHGVLGSVVLASILFSLPLAVLYFTYSRFRNGLGSGWALAYQAVGFFAAMTAPNVLAAGVAANSNDRSAYRPRRSFVRESLGMLYGLVRQRSSPETTFPESAFEMLMISALGVLIMQFAPPFALVVIAAGWLPEGPLMAVMSALCVLSAVVGARSVWRLARGVA